MASRGQRSWYRIDLPEAPQGHGLACDWGSSRFVSHEQADGQWVLWRQDTSGYQTQKAVVPTFKDVRVSVDEAVRVYESRSSNPIDLTELNLPHTKYLRTGIGALIGAVVGIILGGLPGVLINHSALTVVGTQVGGILGAATGAVLADGREPEEAATEFVNNPSPDIKKLKTKLLR